MQAMHILWCHARFMQATQFGQQSWSQMSLQIYLFDTIPGKLSIEAEYT